MSFGHKGKNLGFQGSVAFRCDGLAVYCRELGIFQKSNRY